MKFIAKYFFSAHVLWLDNTFSLGRRVLLEAVS